MEKRLLNILAINRIPLYNALSFAFSTIFLLGIVCVKAQTTASPPQPSASPQQTGTNKTSTESARAINSANVREVEGAFNDLHALEISRTVESSNNRSIIELTHHIYRKPSKSEMKVLTPSPDYFNKYALFLRQPHTGIIKLNSDSNCSENPSIITAKENCLQYSMPGAGTSYSFRVEGYRISRLADLTLSKNVLKSDGILQHGILVKLGDIPIEDVTLQTGGLKYLVDFEPLTNVESLAALDRQLLEGIKFDGFVYGLGFYVRNQATYALRSIAYNGKAMRSVNGIAYNELDFDKRKDILVVFQVIEVEANGNTTLIWKTLSIKDAPTLKIKQIKETK